MKYWQNVSMSYVAELAKRNMPVKEIADITKVSVKVVQKWLAKA
ncbi:MAG: hypothetical protein Q4F24_04265 [Eubacteriales bacterium]|nr:hypothetical protein [Eubacteriales bacterium]